MLDAKIPVIQVPCRVSLKYGLSIRCTEWADVSSRNSYYELRFTCAPVAWNSVGLPLPLQLACLLDREGPMDSNVRPAQLETGVGRVGSEGYQAIRHGDVSAQTLNWNVPIPYFILRSFQCHD